MTTHHVAVTIAGTSVTACCHVPVWELPLSDTLTMDAGRADCDGSVPDQTPGRTGVPTTLGHAVTVARVDPVNERAAWLAMRRRGLGGSDAAAICGQSPYRSALHVYLEKTGALGDEDIDNERMFWGRTLEPIVADVLEQRTNVRLRDVGAMLAHPEHEWMLASVDRAADADPLDCELPVVGTGVAEIKTAGHFAGKDWENDATPDAYVLQGMHYLAVTGLPWLLYGCLIGGQRLVFRVVQRDDELIEHLLEIEARFWQDVQEGRPPMPDGSAATTDLLAHLWDVAPGSVLTLDPFTVDPLLERRAAAAADEKAAKHAKAEIDNRLRWLIGENEEAIAPDGRKLFTWKATKTGARRLYIPTPKEITE